MSIIAPFSKPVMLAILAFVATLGSFGGYTVIKEEPCTLSFERCQHIVTEVIDGDTIVVDDTTTIQLAGIKAPSIHECFGEESKRELTELALNKRVALFNEDNIDKDADGILLRYVILQVPHPEDDNIHVNNYLVANGFARVHTETENELYYDRMTESELEALEAGIGMWGECDGKE